MPSAKITSETLKQILGAECCHPNCYKPSADFLASQVPLCEMHMMTVYRATNQLLSTHKAMGQDYQLLPSEAEFIPGPCPGCGKSGLLVHLANGLVACKTGNCDYDRPLTEFWAERKRMMAIAAGANNVVYYMRFADRAKIGTTKNLQVRMTNINPEDCMAFELGDRRQEVKRHKQFAHLRIHGEWFDLTPDLVSHINTLQIT